MTPLLETRALTRSFEGVLAVDNLDMHLEEGEILGLIGPNGAGKSTTFNIVAGDLLPSKGDVLLEGNVVTGLSAHRMARLGVLRTFQHNMPFPGLSLRENVMVGAVTRARVGLSRAILGTPTACREEAAQRRAALALLELVELNDVAPDGEVEGLTFGQGRLLEIARALAARPRILLLDEPAAGLTRSEVDHLSRIIRQVRDQGVSVLVVEHDMEFLLPLADRVVVLERGRKIADAAPAEVRRDHNVLEAYLGHGHAPHS